MAAQEEKVARKQAVTWEEIVSTQLPGDMRRIWMPKTVSPQWTPRLKTLT